MERNFSNGALTCICITYVGDGCEKLIKTFSQDAAPTSGFGMPDEPRWLVAQRQVELESELDLNEMIRSDRKAYASLLEDLMHPN
jgi:hypothetical protein